MKAFVLFCYSCSSLLMSTSNLKLTWAHAQWKFFNHIVTWSEANDTVLMRLVDWIRPWLKFLEKGEPGIGGWSQVFSQTAIPVRTNATGAFALSQPGSVWGPWPKVSVPSIITINIGFDNMKIVVLIFGSSLLFQCFRIVFLVLEFRIYFEYESIFKRVHSI